MTVRVDKRGQQRRTAEFHPTACAVGLFRYRAQIADLEDPAVLCEQRLRRRTARHSHDITAVKQGLHAINTPFASCIYPARGSAKYPSAALEPKIGKRCGKNSHPVGQAKYTLVRTNNREFCRFFVDYG